MESIIYNQDGKEIGKIALPEQIFGLKWNADLVHQVVTAMQGNARDTIAHAKGRGEVRGGGKKPWRQKGTGRARHGSIRSPIWKGGGVTHGPKSERNYAQKINKKMKTKALFTVLARKWRDGEVVLVNDLNLTKPATQTAAGVLSKLAKATGQEKLAYKTGRRVLLAAPAADKNFNLSFRNLPSVLTRGASELNPVETLAYRYLVLVDPEKSLAVLTGKKK